MLDDFNIITTSPYLPTNAVFKTNISFWIRVIFLWGNAVCFAGTISKQNMTYSLKSCTMPFEGVQCAFPDVQPSFQRSSTPFRKVNISAWYMQYYRHRASLSKVQYVWNCEHYHMFKQCLIVLRFNDGHSSSYNIFQEGSCLHQRVLFPKYGSLSWKNITLCIQKNDVQLWKTYLTCLHVPCVLHLRKYIVKRCEKGIACARGFIFDIEVD